MSGETELKVRGEKGGNTLMEEKRLLDESQYLTFLLKNELFGVEILKVKEIIEYNGITRVPMVPDYIRGVINLRGNVVPVVDLMYLFARKPAEITRRSCIIIVEAEAAGETIYSGILVDSVNEVLEINPSTIEPPPSFGVKINTEFILGMGKLDERIIILLNLKYLLSFEELAELSKVDISSLKLEEGEKIAGK